MTGSEAVPAMVAHYAASLRARSKATPEITVGGGRAALTIRRDDRALTLTFCCRRKKWRLHGVEVVRGVVTTRFTVNELAKAIAALLGRPAPAMSGPGAVTGTSGPRTDAALRERRATVIRA